MSFHFWAAGTVSGFRLSSPQSWFCAAVVATLWQERLLHLCPPALRCITATYYDKTRKEGNGNDLRGTGLFTHYYHMCIINMAIILIMAIIALDSHQSLPFNQSLQSDRTGWLLWWLLIMSTIHEPTRTHSHTHTHTPPYTSQISCKFWLNLLFINVSKPFGGSWWWHRETLVEEKEMYCYIHTHTHKTRRGSDESFL